MLQCLEGLKHAFAAVANCCDSELYKSPRGLENPEALARETVCTFAFWILFHSMLDELVLNVAVKWLWHVPVKQE